MPRQQRLDDAPAADRTAVIRVIETEIQDEDSKIETPAPEAVAANAPARRPKIPIEINERVLKWIRFFTDDARDRFGRFLERGSAYKPLVQKILRENGVPPELYYLAMIESGYVLKARSRAHAVGAWQFVRGTGKLYGLKQNRYVDERRDIIRSTRAAARLLKNLYGDFHSWYLAMAAYNAGEGRILHAIARGRSQDFWKLVELGVLPPETRDYVPKFLAAAIIGKNPERYGFKIKLAEPYPKVAEARVPGGVRLSAIAKKLGVPAGKLRSLNPHLVRAITPVRAKSYPIWVPARKLARVAAIRPSLVKLRVRCERPAPRRPRSRSRKIVHRVRRGEALVQIAHRYHLPVRRLKRINSLHSSRIYPGQRLIVKTGF